MIPIVIDTKLYANSKSTTSHFSFAMAQFPLMPSIHWQHWIGLFAGRVPNLISAIKKTYNAESIYLIMI